MTHKAGKTLSILSRIDQPIGAMTRREEAKFEDASAIIDGDQATVTFKNGSKKVYRGSFAIRGLADISERQNIAITILD
jgi:hypothetical protein